ncbi:hypothetical protein PROFUN_04665 [Planoprotostelium fungivorum]|uniref:RING-type domain-containing protein n=1 Tax=Planoprotostelium fungivorum TaxID=1890364 RepID=A0A2P6NUU7_9EUKA|nr:hypothetical protein PROFUN_04665 [Planoprotostelium fungivorum]
MGICKCKRRTDLFCYVHKKAVCETCITTDHRLVRIAARLKSDKSQCVVRTYVEWLTESEYEDPICPVCKDKIQSDGDVLRLLCMHLIHPECLDVHASSLPNHTAKAGYQCPDCQKPIFPPPDNRSPLAQQINDHLSNASWSRGLMAKSITEQPQSSLYKNDEIAISLPQTTLPLSRSSSVGELERPPNTNSIIVDINSIDSGVASRKHGIRESGSNNSIFIDSSEEGDKYQRRSFTQLLVALGLANPPSKSKSRGGTRIRLNTKKMIVIAIVMLCLLTVIVFGSSISTEEEPAEKKIEEMQEEQFGLCVVAGCYEKCLFGYHFDLEEGTEFKQKFITLAHEGCVKAVNSFDSIITSSSTDQAIRVFDLSRLKDKGRLTHHTGPVTCLSFSSEKNRHMISGSDDGTLVIWKCDEWIPVKTLTGHKGPVHSVSIHPSNKIALSSSKDKNIKLWNLINGKCAHTTKLDYEVDLVAWSPSGDTYTLVSNDRLITYGTSTSEQKLDLKTPKRVNTALYLTEDLIAYGGEDSAFNVYSLEKQQVVFTKKVHENRMKDMTLVPRTEEEEGEMHIITVSTDGFIKLHLWNGETLVEKKKKHTDARLTCVTALLTEEPRGGLKQKESTEAVKSNGKKLKMKKVKKEGEEGGAPVKRANKEEEGAPVKKAKKEEKGTKKEEKKEGKEEKGTKKEKEGEKQGKEEKKVTKKTVKS